MKVLLLFIFTFLLFECGFITRTKLVSGVDYKSHSLVCDGMTRTYSLHRPKNQNSTVSKLPLVVMLHGRFGTGLQLMEQTQFNELSDKENFAVVYPDGLNRSWADGRGNTPSDKAFIDDVKFIESMIKQISLDYPINLEKIFIAGHSNGGFMTQRMLLERSNLFVGGVSVASQLSKELLRMFEPKNPVSVEFIVGTGDPLVPYYGGYVRDGGEILSAEESFDRWKKWNQCPSILEQKHIDTVADGTSVDELKYMNCKENSVVKLIRVNEGGHSWPGQEQKIPFVKMGKPTLELNGSDEVLLFFKGLGL